MLAVSLESRSVDVKYRSKIWYLTLHAAAINFGFAGLVILVIGVNNHGLDPIFAIVGWSFPAAVAAAAAVDLFLIGLSIENESKKRAAQEKKRAADIAIRTDLEQTWRGRVRLHFTQEGRRLRKLP